MTKPLNISELLANLNLQGLGAGSTPKAAENVKYAGPLALKGSLETDPAYAAYMDSLGILYGLKDLSPSSLKWGDIQGLDKQTIGGSFMSPPRFMANPGFDHPKLAISLIPKLGSKNVSGFDNYHAPILLRDVDRWQFAANTLGKYQVNRYAGVEPGKEMFSQSRSFKEIAETQAENWNLKDSTPVVECIVLVPIAPNGEFELEFMPQIRFDSGDHTSYKISMVKEDALSQFSAVHRSGTIIDLKDIDHEQKEYNFTANFVPDLSEIEQLLTPTSRGHFIIIANPTEPPKSKFDLGSFDLGGLGGGYGGYDSPSRSMSFGPMRGGASLGDISIGRGSQTGKGSLFTGELTNSRKGTTTIFHVKLIGVKPEVAKGLDLSTLGALSGALGAYQQN